MKAGFPCCLANTDLFDQATHYQEAAVGVALNWLMGFVSPTVGPDFRLKVYKSLKLIAKAPANPCAVGSLGAAVFR